MSYNPAPGSVAELAAVYGIDLKATGATTLYTVPSGRKLIVTGLILEVTGASGVIAAATAGAGKSSSYNEVVAATVLTGLNGLGMIVDLTKVSLLQIRQTFAAGETVAFNVTVGATATTLNAAAHLLGYLI